MIITEVKNINNISEYKADILIIPTKYSSVCDFECDLDCDYPLYSPCLKGHSNLLKASPKGYPDTTIDPTFVFYQKKTSPECQTVSIKYKDSVSECDSHYQILKE